MKEYTIKFDPTIKVLGEVAMDPIAVINAWIANPKPEDDGQELRRPAIVYDGETWDAVDTRHDEIWTIKESSTLVELVVWCKENTK